jgi:hypothetical protein
LIVSRGKSSTIVSKRLIVPTLADFQITKDKKKKGVHFLINMHAKYTRDQCHS